VAFRQHGFTLIEMLVVFGVFALIGVISSQIVSRVIDNQQLMSARGERLAEVQRAMQIIQRDVLQLAARPVRDELGDPIDPIRIGADGLMEFSRVGWRNPLSIPRAEVQRVAYVTQDGDLYRAYWPVLDRAPGVEPALQALLSDVEQIEFYALDVSGNEHSFWPLEGDLRVDPNAALAGIVLRIDIRPFGVVERLWPVAPPPAAGLR
jgi:general secretion pathway protein J